MSVVWISSCNIRNARGVEVQCLAAILAGSYEDARRVLAAHLATSGMVLLWLEDVLSGEEYFARYGQLHRIGPLAREVTVWNPVVLGEMVPLTATVGPETSVAGVDAWDWLRIEEIEGVEPLDAQVGNWSKKTVPDALHNALFGQPKATEAEIARYGSAEAVPLLRTYAVLDAAKMPYLLTSLLEESGLRHQSLFQGDTQQALKDQAPYLVEMTDDSDFARKLFTGPKGAFGLWDKEPGIFFRSRAGFDGLRRHLRKFTRMQDEQGKWSYFRFWESAVMPGFLGRIGKDRLEIFQALYCGTETCPIASVIMPRAGGLPVSILTGMPRPDGANSQPLQFRLTANDQSCFRDAMWSDFTVRFRRDMGDRARKAYGMTLSGFDEYYDRVLRKEAGMFRGSERDFSTFVALSFEHGVGFWDDPRIAALMADNNLLRSGKIMDAVLYHVKKVMVHGAR